MWPESELSELDDRFAQYTESDGSLYCLHAVDEIELRSFTRIRYEVLARLFNIRTQFFSRFRVSGGFEGPD